MEEDVDQVEGGVLACPLLKLPEHHLQKSREEIGPSIVDGLEDRWRLELIFDFKVDICIIAIVRLAYKSGSFVHLGEDAKLFVLCR